MTTKVLNGIDFSGAKFGSNGEGNPFNGDMSSYVLSNLKLEGVDLSKVSKWPAVLKKC